MIGIYLSGTGNTKYCLNKLTRALDENSAVYALSLKEEENIVNEIKNN